MRRLASAVVVARAGRDAAEPAHAPALKAGVLSPVMAAPALKLQGTDGKPLDLARFKGKVVLLAFGFSNCGEVCPITLATLAGARKKLGADAATCRWCTSRSTRNGTPPRR